MAYPSTGNEEGSSIPHLPNIEEICKDQGAQALIKAVIEYYVYTLKQNILDQLNGKLVSLCAMDRSDIATPTKGRASQIEIDTDGISKLVYETEKNRNSKAVIKYVRKAIAQICGEKHFPGAFFPESYILAEQNPIFRLTCGGGGFLTLALTRIEPVRPIDAMGKHKIEEYYEKLQDLGAAKPTKGDKANSLITWQAGGSNYVTPHFIGPRERHHLLAFPEAAKHSPALEEILWPSRPRKARGQK